MGTTEPLWIIMIYYIIMGATLVTSVVSLIRLRLVLMSFIQVTNVAASFVLTLIIAMGRPEGVTEFRYIADQAIAGSAGAIYVGISDVLIIIWWYLFLMTKKQEPIRKRRYKRF
ncbi:hypothetical protein BVG16_27210 [Paenibacillus selenitireducens]|uniref:Uncharacterized protein n=1 Tax=Paenibacillus selenitireducens TaxID=1324314 RepID=A0A1T2X1N3_9BACL|nr:hypothetical protein [Paenibacillus selenitireducens]OPA73774.1 hypothetical protein BVG16_27210 [Paenibacillus selenitireducens]